MDNLLAIQVQESARKSPVSILNRRTSFWDTTFMTVPTSFDVKHQHFRDEIIHTLRWPVLAGSILSKISKFYILATSSSTQTIYQRLNPSNRCVKQRLRNYSLSGRKCENFVERQLSWERINVFPHFREKTITTEYSTSSLGQMHCVHCNKIALVFYSFRSFFFLNHLHTKLPTNDVLNYVQHFYLIWILIAFCQNSLDTGMPGDSFRAATASKN